MPENIIGACELKIEVETLLFFYGSRFKTVFKLLDVILTFLSQDQWYFWNSGRIAVNPVFAPHSLFRRVIDAKFMRFVSRLFYATWWMLLSEHSSFFKHAQHVLGYSTFAPGEWNIQTAGNICMKGIDWRGTFPGNNTDFGVTVNNLYLESEGGREGGEKQFMVGREVRKSML